MVGPVDLDYKSPDGTVGVDHIRSDRSLSPKLQTRQAATAELRPKFPFDSGHLALKLTCTSCPRRTHPGRMVAGLRLRQPPLFTAFLTAVVGERPSPPRLPARRTSPLRGEASHD